MPKAIAKRISDISSKKGIFDKSVLIYQNALCESGFKVEWKYKASDTSFQEENNQITRSRKIIWLNPSYSRSVKTNISINFLHSLLKYFPVNHKMHKIFNKNTVKVNYSCMKNMDSILSGHNLVCNCKKKDSCRLQWQIFDTKSNIPSLKFQMKLITKQKFYSGLAEINFKVCYSNHKRNVKHIKYQYNRELAKYIWN